MKKIISLFIVMLMSLSFTVGVFADSVGVFEGMMILESLTNKAQDDIVKRDEFAALAATLMGKKEITAKNTKFTDVKEDNEYASAIEFVAASKVMNGIGNSLFAPKQSITVKDALVVFIRVLGFEQNAKNKGGYPDGYINVAIELGAFKYIGGMQDDALTFSDLWSLADWALEAPMAENTYFTNGDTFDVITSLSKKNPTLLEKNLGLTLCEAKVEGVNAKEYTIDATITSSKDDSKYQKGVSYTFEASAGINILEYDKTQVKMWLNDEDEIMYMALDKDCTVIYGTVSSVNDDNEKTSRYHTDDIEKFMLYDLLEEYEISENGLSFFKNEKSYSGYITLNDSYIRAVLLDDTVISIETWDFKNGGLIEAKTEKEITLQNGRVKEIMKNLSSYSKKVLFLDNELRDFKDLKVGSVVDYWVSDDKETIVFAASEIVHTDVFNSIHNSGDIQVGNLILKKSTPLYSTVNGTEYKENSENELLGHTVDALMDAFGKVRYLRPTENVEERVFAGYLYGVNSPSGISTTVKAKIVNLDDKEFASGIYIISEKVKYFDEVSLDTLVANKDKKSYKSVFEFKVNAKGEISEIGLLDPYYGYSDGVSLVQQTLTAGSSVPSTSIWSWNADNPDGERRRLFMTKSQRIVGIYDVNGETMFKNTDMAALGNTYANDVMLITYYGEEMTSDYRLVLVEGANMVEHGSAWGKAKFDFVTSVESALFDDGEIGKNITIGGSVFNVPSNYLDVKFNHDNGAGKIYDDVSVGALVCYWDKSYFGDKNVVINSMYNLPTNIDRWQEGTTLKIGSGSDAVLKKGVVEHIDDMRIFLRDGDVLFFNSDHVNFRVITEGGKVKEGSPNDFIVGREVFYIVDGNLGNTVPLVIYAE